MRKKNIKETDFFKQTNILLTPRHRNMLDELKKLAILSNNINIDSSTFIRAMLCYLKDNPSVCSEIKDYLIANKGSSYIVKYNSFKSSGLSDEEIIDRLGIDETILEKIHNSSK